ncbi:hypothetical protein BI344_14310 [Chromobacterium sphagni]|uniref:Uncharacterized protein n=1 Tax=Chromobacterium sphagni TaxID=1903179 RepID=A0ABX3CFE1_9NEIS|nr:hypothetical protein BI344_14310 [Chromobacterium sphagni]
MALHAGHLVAHVLHRDDGVDRQLELRHHHRVALGGIGADFLDAADGVERLLQRLAHFASTTSGEAPE